MTRRRIRANEYDRHVTRQLRAMRRLVEDAAEEACARAVGELVAATDALGLVDQGQYRQGWEHKRTRRGAVVGNAAPHALAIERGRRPGRPGPPLEPIRRWVERKIAPPPGEVEGIARAIRDKIHREGSKPRLIFRSYQPRLRKLFRAAIRARLRKVK